MRYPEFHCHSLFVGSAIIAIIEAGLSLAAAMV
jgi:hypothetical protein